MARDFMYGLVNPTLNMHVNGSKGDI